MVADPAPHGSALFGLDPSPDIHKLERLKMGPSRSLDAHNGGVEAQNRALEGL